MRIEDLRRVLVETDAEFRILNEENLSDGDVLVCSINDDTSQETMDQISALLGHTFNGKCPVLIVPKSFEFKVIKLTEWEKLSCWDLKGSLTNK